MSKAIVFDTLEYTKTLEESGMPEKQAEALTRANKVAFENLVENDVATKRDLMSVTTELMNVKSELKHDIEQVKGEIKLLRWMTGFILAGITALILKAFFGI